MRNPSGPATVTGMTDYDHCAGAWEGRSHYGKAGSQETCLCQRDVHAFGSKGAYGTDGRDKTCLGLVVTCPKRGRVFCCACAVGIGCLSLSHRVGD